MVTVAQFLQQTKSSGTSNANGSINLAASAKLLGSPSVSATKAPMTIKSSGGGSSASTGQTPTANVAAPAPAAPSFFSWEGQQQALSRVVNVLNPFANNPIALVNPITNNVIAQDVGAPVRSIVRVSEVGTLLWGGSLLSSSGAAAATVAAKTAPVAQLSNLIWPAAIGFTAASLLNGGGSASTAPQTITQQPTQQTNQNPNITPSISPAGTLTGTAGRDLFQLLTQPSTQSTTPYFSQSPTQDLTANPTQTAGASTNWALIAAIGLGAYFLLKR